MSKMSNAIVRDADEHALDNAAELARLRDVIARVRTLLDEGDPEGTLHEIADQRDFDGCWEAEKALRAVARAIREALALLDD